MFATICHCLPLFANVLPVFTSTGSVCQCLSLVSSVCHCLTLFPTALKETRRTPPAITPGAYGGNPDASQRLPGPSPSVYSVYLWSQGSLSTIGNQKTLLNSIRQLQNCCFWALKRPPACLTLQNRQSAMWWSGLHLAGWGCYRQSPLSRKIRSNYQFWPSGSDFSETSYRGWSRVIAGGRRSRLLATHLLYINPDELFCNQIVLETFLRLKFTTL